MQLIFWILETIFFFFQTEVKIEENGSRKWKKMVSTSQKIRFLQLKYGISYKLVSANISNGFHLVENF